MLPVDYRERSDKSKTYCGGVGRTKQSFKAECDINAIMARYIKTGVIEHTARYAPQYGDFSDVKSYQEALHAVQEADAMFMSLPAQVRAKFDNDAGKFLDFVQDPSNVDEMGKLGLANPKVDVSKPSKESEQSST